MKSYSQSQEDLFVLDYFKGSVGRLLEIGANDGITLSNSKLLIDHGFSAVLVEPSSVFDELEALYTLDEYILCYNVAIGAETGKMTLHESGAHVRGGSDRALVSSLVPGETKRWAAAGVEFEKREVTVFSWLDFWEWTGRVAFDFISIDAEGFDWIILQQMDLAAIGCKCLCIEHNGDEGLKTTFCEHCAKFGLKPALVNRENIIFVK